MQTNIPGVIDRFEGTFAVVKTGSGFMRILKSKLPPHAREGAHILIGENGITLDEEKTRAALEKAAALLKDLE